MSDSTAITEGVGPAYQDVHIGMDGQLWRWNEGQVIIATSGTEAMEYARNNNWPWHLVEVLKAKQAR